MTWAMDWETKNLRLDLERLIAAGGGGGGGQGFRFVQAVASVTWIVDHSLGFWPNVTVVDSSRRVIYAEVNYASATQVVLSFSSAVAGEAYLS